MANSRYLIVSRSNSLPSPLLLCTACTLFLTASALDALAVEKHEVFASLPETSSIAKRDEGTLAKRLSPQSKSHRSTTALKTSAASRVSTHRAGSLSALAPQKAGTGLVRIALVDESSSNTQPNATAPEVLSTATTENPTPENATVPAAAPIDIPAAETTSSASVESDSPKSTPSDKSGSPSNPAKLTAAHISYDRNLIIAVGDENAPVCLESNDVKIFAKRVVLDTIAKTVTADGQVRLERQIQTKRFNTFRPKSQPTSKFRNETITETLKGDNFKYNFGAKEGQLDHVSLRLSTLNVTADNIIINGQKYVAHNVVIRPGGLSDEELKIYGTPPFNLRAKTVTVDNSRSAPDARNNIKTENSAEGTSAPRTEVKSAALYFRNLRLLPVPSALLRRSGGPREEETYQITPRIFFNSADGLLVTARLQFPLIRAKDDQNSSKSPTLDLITDLGVSTRVGFRGGIELDSDSRIGELSIGARINDVVSSQLTDRIELDRLPEVRYRPPSLRLISLPGSRVAGLRFNFTAGDYRESLTSRSRVVKDSKLEAQAVFTTRLGKKEGPYFNLFARSARYGNHPENLNTQGFEVGYIGQLTSRINGQFSYRAQNVDGSTPFRFDEVEIRRELRTTFDVMLTPRWLVPIDLRYDMDRGELRNKSIGLLRNYKTFAYGLMYESARSELRFELRQGF